MLHVTWESSLTVPEGELIPEPFDGELQAGILLGLEFPAEGQEGDAGRLRVESYGADDDLARLVAIAFCNAHERGYLPAALGYAARMSPGAAAYLLRAAMSEE